MEDLFTQPTPPRGPLTVSELVGGVRELLEERLQGVRVVGEVSDLFRARSGHSYFSLKDGNAQIKAVLFAGTAARIPFDPENGLEIIVRGEVTVYPQRGDLQILVRGLEPVGRGELQLAFEQLRARLGDEGLFDAALKRALPTFPRRIGIVTSPSGAAVRDVVQVSGKRFPGTPLLISPTPRAGGGRRERDRRSVASRGRRRRRSRRRVARARGRFARGPLGVQHGTGGARDPGLPGAGRERRRP